jgi:hypothetical protein
MCEIPQQNPFEKLKYTLKMKDKKVKQALFGNRYQWEE